MSGTQTKPAFGVVARPSVRVQSVTAPRETISPRATPIGFVATVRAHPQIAAFLASVQQGSYSLDTTALLDEIERIHMTRKLRNLTPEQILKRTQFELMDANLQNSANRSRIVEIKMQATRKINLLWERAEKARKFINLQYRDRLKDEHRTIGERTNAVDTVLAPVQDVTNQLEQVTAMADLVIDDLDQAGYTLKRLGDVVMLSTRPERNI